MATSDNVLRAGLTPKHRDVDNLLASLTWTFGAAHAVTPAPTPLAETAAYSSVYAAPVPEFAVVRVALPPGAREVHRACAGPSILVVTRGAGTLGAAGGDDGAAALELGLELEEGAVVFIGAGVGVAFASGSADRLELYRAYYP